MEAVRICYLFPELKGGGSEKHVIQLACALRQRGYDARITCIFREGPLAREAREREIPFVCLNLPYRWGLRTLLSLFHWIRSNPMDILHTYLFGFHFFAGLSARFLKIPIIISSRRGISYEQKRRHRWLEKLGNLFVDRVICCSKAVEAWTLEKEQISPAKVLTVYNGVDRKQFDSSGSHSNIRQEFHIPSDAPLIGTVANMAIEKGYPYLLEAAQLIFQKLPKAWFLFVGFGPLEQEIKEKARQFSGHEQIIFAGARTDITNLMEAMDVFVLASIMEGFPNVLLEALAMAKPVVATRVGGIPELIESGQNGTLVPPRSGEALADAVLSLLADPVHARLLGKRGQEKIERGFTLERMVNQYEEFYLALLKSQGVEDAQKEKITFSFGKNWQKFLKDVNPQSFENAERSLTEFLGFPHLKGKSFLDIGCGSGLFSYAAFRLGAERIVSFDADSFSVECCNYLYQKAGAPSSWTIYEGSILDPSFVSQLGTFDFVYAWGVLHHTGKLWDAIRNAAERVAPGGYFYLAIYNKVGGIRGSEFWLRIKKFYNTSPRIIQYGLETLYILIFFLRRFIRFRNPMTEVRNYRFNRGMNWRRDISDWLGGYPYEFATVEEVFKFVRSNFPDFNLVNIKTTDNVGSNWYLFENQAAKEGAAERHVWDRWHRSS